MGGPLDAIPVALTGEQTASVAVAMAWSTVGLSCQEWLYGPRLHAADVTGGVFVSFETTVGKTVFCPLTVHFFLVSRFIYSAGWFQLKRL